MKLILRKDLENNFNIIYAKENQHIINLLNSESFSLSYLLTTMARNHNYFGQVDSYMREFSKILSEFPDPSYHQRLERALNRELAIVP